jgi:hypothetical protein
VTEVEIGDENVAEPAANDNEFVYKLTQKAFLDPLGPMSDSEQKASEIATEGKCEMSEPKNGCYNFDDLLPRPSSSEFVYKSKKTTGTAEINRVDTAESGSVSMPIRTLPTFPKLQNDCAKGFKTRSWGDVLDAEIKEQQFFLGNLFSCGHVSVLFGQGGLGKSRLALNAARNQVLGFPFLGLDTGNKPLKHLFIGSENDIYRWKNDMSCMTRGLSAEQHKLLTQHIRVTTLEEPGDSYINLGDPGTVRKWEDTLHELPPDVLWCDPWGDMIAGDSLRDGDIRATLGTLRKMVSKVNPDCGIVILAHARTGTANVVQVCGFDAANFGKDSKALQACARTVVNLAPFNAEKHPDIIWNPAKCNDGVKPDGARIRLDPETMTYAIIAEMDDTALLAWQNGVKADAKEARRNKPIYSPFDNDAVLELVAEKPMLVGSLKAEIRSWGVTRDNCDNGYNQMLLDGKLMLISAGKANGKLVGTPEAIQNYQNPQVLREV